MASQQPIFRTISVGVGQHIELGKPLSDDVRALFDPAPPGARHLRMRIGTYGHAASIEVYLADANGPVRHIDFTYDQGTDYEALVKLYEEDLGPAHDTGTVADTNESSVWEDGQTLFQVWLRGVNVGSLLKDLTAPSA